MSLSTPNKTKTGSITPTLSVRLSQHRLNPAFPLACFKDWSPPAEPIDGLFFHDYFEIGLCHEGSGVLIMGSKALPYKAGDICAIRQFDSHFHIGTKGVKTIWSFIFFDTVKLLKAALYDTDLADTSGLTEPNISPVLSGEKYPKLNQAYHLLYNELCENKNIQRDAAIGLTVFFLSLLNKIKVSHQPLKFNVYSEDTDRIGPALAHIGKNFRNELTVTELSEICGMSGRNFTRRFSEATGKAPMEYINEIRIAMAKSDLRASQKKVIEIALDNGFGSVSNFGKAFTKNTGMSPRFYRNLKP